MAGKIERSRTRRCKDLNLIINESESGNGV